LRNVVLLPQAVEDISQIGDPLNSKIIKQLHALEEFPEYGAAMTGPFQGYRSFVVGIFRVVYFPEPDGPAYIAYIRHCNRRPLA
jgi:plasmid stabilization system protein ParE